MRSTRDRVERLHVWCRSVDDWWDLHKTGWKDYTSDADTPTMGDLHRTKLKLCTSDADLLTNVETTKDMEEVLNACCRSPDERWAVHETDSDANSPTIGVIYTRHGGRFARLIQINRRIVTYTGDRLIRLHVWCTSSDELWDLSEIAWTDYTSVVDPPPNCEICRWQSGNITRLMQIHLRIGRSVGDRVEDLHVCYRSADELWHLHQKEWKDYSSDSNSPKNSELYTRQGGQIKRLMQILRRMVRYTRDRMETLFVYCRSVDYLWDLHWAELKDCRFEADLQLNDVTKRDMVEGLNVWCWSPDERWYIH